MEGVRRHPFVFFRRVPQMARLRQVLRGRRAHVDRQLARHQAHRDHMLQLRRCAAVDSLHLHNTTATACYAVLLDKNARTGPQRCSVHACVRASRARLLGGEAQRYRRAPLCQLDVYQVCQGRAHRRLERKGSQPAPCVSDGGVGLRRCGGSVCWERGMAVPALVMVRRLRTTHGRAASAKAEAPNGRRSTQPLANHASLARAD